MAAEDLEGQDLGEKAPQPEPQPEPIPMPGPASEPIPAPEPQPEPQPGPSRASRPAGTFEPAPSFTYEPGPSASGTAPSQASDWLEGVRTALKGFARMVSEWLNGWFPGHGNTVLFGILGLVLALLIFKIGFWRSLVITVLVIGGVAFGQQLDGDPKILRFLRDLLGRGE